MIIYVSNYQQYTLEIRPVDHGWEIRAANSQSWHDCNDAGLNWAFANFRSLADRTNREVQRERERCRYNLPFRCPENFVCQQSNQQQQQVAILLSHYEPDRIPIGQMSLFEQDRTHRHIWRHYRTGKVSEAQARPLQAVITPVCQRMAVAILEWHRRQWTEIPFWRIVPLKNDLAGREWLLALQNKYAARIPACVFDEWGVF